MNTLRTVFFLPHSSSLPNCDVGFFKDVFLELKNKVEEDPANADCTLLCDAMKIKSSTIYNKETVCFEGFVNYGNDIIVDDENEIAADALVFMLVSLKNSWKYPIGYVLINGIDATNSHSLLSQALKYSVTMMVQVRILHLWKYLGVS